MTVVLSEKEDLMRAAASRSSVVKMADDDCVEVMVMFVDMLLMNDRTISNTCYKKRNNY